MVSFPICKINLGLHVLSKRSDGYHNIETCFYPVERTDILEIIPSKEFSFSSSGMKIDGDSPDSYRDNLCVKAFRLLQKESGIGEAKIHLHKIIPIGAGLGGGSADAAYTLLLANDIFNLKLTKTQLKNFASQIGSDCAFFIDNQPMIGSGRGEILTPTSVSLATYFLVLVKPNVHVSTADAYAGIVPKQNEKSIQEILKLPIKEWKGKLVNDFEETILKKHSIIKEVKEKLYSLGAKYASMSGSGASVFGIFENAVDLKNDFVEMDYWAGELK